MRGKKIRSIWFGGPAAAAALAVALVVFMPVWSARTVALHVEFRLTDQNNQPLPGVPVRLVFGGR
jgi:hypothetical protein